MHINGLATARFTRSQQGGPCKQSTRKALNLSSLSELRRLSHQITHTMSTHLKTHGMQTRQDASHREHHMRTRSMLQPNVRASHPTTLQPSRPKKVTLTCTFQSGRWWYPD